MGMTLSGVSPKKRRKKAIEVARYLKSSGTSIKLIMGATGLTKEEIEEL